MFKSVFRLDIFIVNHPYQRISNLLRNGGRSPLKKNSLNPAPPPLNRWFYSLYIRPDPVYKCCMLSIKISANVHSKHHTLKSGFWIHRIILDRSGSFGYGSTWYKMLKRKIYQRHAPDKRTVKLGIHILSKLSIEERNFFCNLIDLNLWF